MKSVLLTALIGVIAGCVDLAPMVKRKLGKHAIASAFVFYFILPFIILHTEMFTMAWWLKGGVISLALAAPVIILVARDDPKSVPPMIVMPLALGTLIGAAGHFLL